MIRDQGCGLPNVWLANGYELVETKWGPTVSVEDSGGLFRAITQALCLSDHQLDGPGVRFLRKRLGLTQDELGAELGCTGQAIAKWEKEESPVPTAAGRLLRAMALAATTPATPVVKAITPYKTPAARRLEFTFDAATGWTCTQPSTATTLLSAAAPRRPVQFDLMAAEGKAGRLHDVQRAFAKNDFKYTVHENQLAAA